MILFYTFLFIIVPITHTIIIGFLFALPIWLFWAIEKLFWHRSPKLNSTFLVLVALISFIIASSFYTYQVIKFRYAMSLSDTPNGEATKYKDDIVKEAFKDSIIPSVFRRCINTKFVCESSENMSLQIWDAKPSVEYLLPLLGGISTAIGSILFVVNGKALFQEE